MMKYDKKKNNPIDSNDTRIILQYTNPEQIKTAYMKTHCKTEPDSAKTVSYFEADGLD